MRQLQRENTNRQRRRTAWKKDCKTPPRLLWSFFDQKDLSNRSRNGITPSFHQVRTLLHKVFEVARLIRLQNP